MKSLSFSSDSKREKLPFPNDTLFDRLRVEEYQRIDKLGHTYLDFTGGNLYARSQVSRHHELLDNSILGNPHSTNPSSQLASAGIFSGRRRLPLCIYTECYGRLEDRRRVLSLRSAKSIGFIIG